MPCALALVLTPERGRQRDLRPRAPHAALRDERGGRIVDLPQAAAPGARVPRIQPLQAGAALHAPIILDRSKALSMRNLLGVGSKDACVSVQTCRPVLVCQPATGCSAGLACYSASCKTMCAKFDLYLIST